MPIIGYFDNSELVLVILFTIKAGDNGDGVTQNDVVKSDRNEELPKEKASRKKKKEKENVEKVPIANKKSEKRLLMLPMEASFVAILLLVLLGAFYVVCALS